MDRIKRVTFDFGVFLKVVEYTYDQASNRKSLVYPDGYTVAYEWDASGRLTGIETADGTWVLIYDSDDRRTATRHPNGLELNSSYDQGGRLTSIATKHTINQTVLQGYIYGYDKVGNRKTSTDMVNGTTVEFAYEEDYALNQTTYEASFGVAYAYDENDNRIWRNQTDGETKEYFYNLDSSVRRVTIRPPGEPWHNTTYLYDENGNLKQKAASTIYTYGYDQENRLTRVSVENLTSATYAYFGDGSRIRRTEAGVTSYFMYDFWDFGGFNDILEEYDSAGATKVRYVHGPGSDEPLSQQYLGTWYYYHTDGLGSVILVTDSAKVVRNSYLYEDFGAFRFRSETIPNSYGFTGREIDFASYFYRARYYDSDVGRFITPDPSSKTSGMNRYVYALNNPISFVDPSGKVPRRSIIGGGSANDPLSLLGKIYAESGECLLDWGCVTVVVIGLVLTGILCAACGACIGGAAVATLGALILLCIVPCAGCIGAFANAAYRLSQGCCI